MVFSKKTEDSTASRGLPDPDQPGGPPGQVETYSGYRVHERPRRFRWQGEWLKVRQVLARWQEPESLCFTVSASDSRRYLLKYHHQRDAWEVRADLTDSASSPG